MSEELERVLSLVTTNSQLFLWADSSDSEENELVVDYTSPREGYLLSIGCLALFATPVAALASLGAEFALTRLLLLVVAAIGPVLLYLRWLTGDHYVVNFAEKTIYRVHAFRGNPKLKWAPKETRQKFLRFDQLHSLILSRYTNKERSPGRGYGYQILLVCQSGQVLAWADVGPNLEGGKRLGSKFSATLDIPFDDSDPTAPINVRKSDGEIKVCRERMSLSNLHKFFG